MGKLKLETPLLVNGENLTELDYDVAAITAENFVEAETQKMKAAGNNPTGAVVEIDAVAHLYFGFAAIIAVNPKIDYNDLKRLTGRDVAEVMRIGRGFFTKSASNSEKVSPDDGSDAA